MAFGLGDAVADTHMQETRIGEVVATQSCGPITMYDVSFERERLYCLLEQDLEPASEAQMRAVAAGFALEDSAASEAMRLPTPETMRNQWLRQRYLKWLNDTLEGRRRRSPDAVSGRFETLDSVVVEGDGKWCLGKVIAVMRDGDQVVYDIEIEDEIERHPESSLTTLKEARLPGPIRLGSRVRYVSEGHRDDPNFEGTISRIEDTPEGRSYVLVFDDGDVFWGVEETDLIVLRP